jgi:hypothetical protein
VRGTRLSVKSSSRSTSSNRAVALLGRPPPLSSGGGAEVPKVELELTVASPPPPPPLPIKVSRPVFGANRPRRVSSLSAKALPPSIDTVLRALDISCADINGLSVIPLCPLVRTGGAVVCVNDEGNVAPPLIVALKRVG